MYFRNKIIIITAILICSCSTQTDKIQPETEPQIATTDSSTTITEPYILPKPFYPSPNVKDSSWDVKLDIQEGFLLNFSIGYKNDSSVFINVENEVPSSGGVDHPEPHFMNDTTFLIPNVGSSPVRYTNILYKVIETSFTLFRRINSKKIESYALERNDNYGTKN